MKNRYNLGMVVQYVYGVKEVIHIMPLPCIYIDLCMYICTDFIFLEKLYLIVWQKNERKIFSRWNSVIYD